MNEERPRGGTKYVRIPLKPREMYDRADNGPRGSDSSPVRGRATARSQPHHPGRQLQAYFHELPEECRKSDLARSLFVEYVPPTLTVGGTA